MSERSHRNDCWEGACWKVKISEFKLSNSLSTLFLLILELHDIITATLTLILLNRPTFPCTTPDFPI